MRLKIKTEPAIEPVTLAELKAHLRIDSEDFADDISVEQSIAPGDHVVAASYSLKGSGVAVTGKSVLVILNSGTNGTNGTVDVKIQEADTDSDGDYVDWSGGAFTQVTEANDNAVQEKAYTGTKAYIRAVATVAVATCDFSASVVLDSAVATEDDLLNSLITAARQACENATGRALITQTWYLYLDGFPSGKDIELPMAPLQSVTAVKYAQSDDTDYDEIFSTSLYDVDTDSEPGRVVLGYGDSWPSATLRPMNPVRLEFVAGYGATTASVPEIIRRWTLLAAAHLYENRDIVDVTDFNPWMLASYRIWNF